ncbi:MAG: ABC transporter permease, partial [Xanthobacteraceae bacterium]
MSTAVETGESSVGLDTSEDRARAGKAAAERRRRRQIQNVAIRVVSIAIVLALWEMLGNRIDPVLFTKPTLVALAAVQMVASGELWTYLAPSLVVLAIGLSLAAVIGIAVGLALARFWVIDVAFGVYITFLYSIPSVALVPLIVLWTGYETTAKVVI